MTSTESRHTAGPVAAPDGEPECRVLNLVTTYDATFYRLQVEGLADLGVAGTTLPVPGRHLARESVRTRSALDYLRYVPAVRRQPLRAFDLVHANYGLTAPAALAQRECPVVVSLWGSDLLGPLGPLARLCARLADATVVMTAEMAAELDGDCHVIPHGVDLDLFRPVDRETALAAVGWDPDCRHVLFPYPTTRAVKNYPVAERVVERADHRLDERVVLHAAGGTVPHEEMPTYMSAADAMLLPSDREGSPNTVKEALACDLPVVSTDVGDVSERLDGVEPSAVCDSEADLVEGLVAVLRAGERCNGRQAAAEVSAERTAERLRDVYRQVLDGRA